MNDAASLHLVCPACMAVNRVPAERLAHAPKCGKCGAKMLDGHPVELSEANFATFVGRNDLPVVVDFWAEWCGPCKMMAPVFAQVAGEFATRARFAKVDTDANQQLAGQFGIRSIPTLAVFKGGREVDRRMGALPAGALKDWLARHLA